MSNNSSTETNKLKQQIQNIILSDDYDTSDVTVDKILHLFKKYIEKKPCRTSIEISEMVTFNKMGQKIEWINKDKLLEGI